MVPAFVYTVEEWEGAFHPKTIIHQIDSEWDSLGNRLIKFTSQRSEHSSGKHACMLHASTSNTELHGRDTVQRYFMTGTATTDQGHQELNCGLDYRPLGPQLRR